MLIHMYLHMSKYTCAGITTDIIANDVHLRSLADKLMIDTITLANEDILSHRKKNPSGRHYIC